MLSYQHSYHAGCLADVIKHLALVQLLEYMLLKPAPLFYLDTHAGRGIYDLQDAHALKTQEAQKGILRLWDNKNALPEVFSSYINIISEFNSGQRLRYYPGSPMIAAHMARTSDRIYACERHPGEFQYLYEHMRGQSKVHCVEEDGYPLLSALLPPPERRGLIFIDPSYEIKSEYRDVAKAVQAAYKRFSTGLFCVWYPLLELRNVQQLHRGLETIPTDKHLCAEFYLKAQPHQSVRGYGLWFINPPFTLKNSLQLIFETLQQLFYPTSTYRISSRHSG